MDAQHSEDESLLVSPYSYPTHGRSRRICEGYGAELILRPMLLDAVQKAAGIVAPVEAEARVRYQAKDIRRWAAYYGLPLRAFFVGEEMFWGNDRLDFVEPAPGWGRELAPEGFAPPVLVFYFYRL